MYSEYVEEKLASKENDKIVSTPKGAKTHIDANGNNTLTSSRQRTDEIRQYSLLSKVKNFTILDPNMLFLYNGNIISKNEISNLRIYGRNKKDLDGIIKYNNKIYPITCRYISIDGTTEYRAFDDLFYDWINQCPLTATSNIIPIMVLGTDNFFSKKRKVYRNYEKHFRFTEKFTTVDLLKRRIIEENKICKIIFEHDLTDLKFNDIEHLLGLIYEKQ